MSAEVFEQSTCDECPLAQLADNEQASAAREWAFSPPNAHEGFQDPRFPGLGMMAMHYGSLCRFRYITNACKLDAPDTAPPTLAD